MTSFRQSLGLISWFLHVASNEQTTAMFCAASWFPQSRTGLHAAWHECRYCRYAPIQDEVFHIVAPTVEHREEGPYNLAVLIGNQCATKS